MQVPDKDLYYVAVKVFLRDGDKLLITHDVYGDWDLPGGRIRIDQFDMPMEEIVEHKLRQELGPEVKYQLGSPTVLMRHQREEKIEGTPTVRIFAVGFEARYLGGAIRLGPSHDQLEWVDVRSFEPQRRFTGGWLRGVREYLEKVRAA